MARIEISRRLVLEIKKTFPRSEANKVLDLVYTTENNPHKEKIVGQVGGILTKELKYKKFRFYFLVDGHKLKAISEAALVDLLLRFVRMSDKKKQEDTIQEIRDILQKIGPAGLE